MIKLAISLLIVLVTSVFTSNAALSTASALSGSASASSIPVVQPPAASSFSGEKKESKESLRNPKRKNNEPQEPLRAKKLHATDEEKKEAKESTLSEASFSTDELKISSIIKKIDQLTQNLPEFGIDALKAGNNFSSYTRFDTSQRLAIACFKRASEMGCVEAMKKLSMCYASGTGIGKNEKIAAELELLAKMTEDSEAMVFKARQLLSQDHAKSWELAVELLTKAEAQKNSNAAAGLGYCYIQGRGLNKDLLRGLELLYNALRKGSPDALYWIATCYSYGLGVLKDEKRAFALSKSAIEKGSIEAMILLGRFYQDGRGCVVDKTEAVALFTKASKRGISAATNDLGWCYFNACGVEADIKKAISLFSTSAEAGNITAWGNLGFCYLYSNVVQDYKKAIEYLNKGAEQGDGFSMKYLGFCYLAGIDDLVIDPKKAFDYFNQALEAQYFLANASLSYCYRLGIGVKKDETKADELLKRAEVLCGKDTTDAEINILKINNHAWDCSEDVCSICQEICTSGQPVSRPEHCKHFFHKDCLQQWLQSPQNGVGDDGGSIEFLPTTCPICRQGVANVENGFAL